MKVTQIVAESTKKPVSEAPVSGLAQFGKKVLAKTAAKVGAKNFASGVAGNVDTGAEANELRKAWQNHQGSIGGKMGANDPAEFKQWLLNNGFKGKDAVIDKAMTDNKITGPFGKGPLDKALLQIVQNSKKASAQGAGADQTATKAQAGATAGAGASKGATAGASATAGAGNEIPQGIKDQLDQLTPGEKKYLSDTLGQGSAPPKATPAPTAPAGATA